MNRSTVASRWNLDLLDEKYARWRRDPLGVEESWRNFFEGYELGAARPDDGGGGPSSSATATPATSSGSATTPNPAPFVGAPGSPNPSAEAANASINLDAARAQAGVTRLVDAYREIGHFLADLDPLQIQKPLANHELLELDMFNLTEADLDRVFYTRLFDPPRATLRELIDALRETYGRTIGVEYMHIPNSRMRSWIQERIEPTRNRPQLDAARKLRILEKLNEAELFERFLHTQFQGQKRFGLEGAESLIPLIDSLIERAGEHQVREIVFGMPHRGRLNVLANILGKPYGMIFSEFEGYMPPETVGGDGDVKYHLGFSGEHVTRGGHRVHLSLTPNPSHLEAVNPVVEGRVRAKQALHNDKGRKLGIPVLIHGDAAFAGQGLVAETLNLSRLKGYGTGGTVHIVVNNQIGFTTAPKDARSTPYCTDVAKMIDVPIFHVNGDDPEAVAHVAELALDFRQAFGVDVVIDLVCYRRFGHNELDEPKFTQPIMYKAIANRPSVKEIYTKHLVETGQLTAEQAEQISERFNAKMQGIYDEVHNNPAPRPTKRPGLAGPWAGMSREYSHKPIETGVPYETLAKITRRTTELPAGFQANPIILRLFAERNKIMAERGHLNWAFAEHLAFGSLALQGHPVRLSGQDSRRGTFSQRHAVIVDVNTGKRYYPLCNIEEGQEQVAVFDSLLSEAAVLGFEYGISLDSPQVLVMWEAQFGDFVNGAQVIIDQFIASGDSKWGRASGLVMLLPHGYEGQGPEHSSARLERFLQLFAEDNIQVVNATTPAQYFHLLRRQMLRDFRLPLVVMTPKSLLRRKEATSPVADLESGHFHEILDDPGVKSPESVKRVILCSGKVYYDLAARRAKAGKDQEIALVRIEQFTPWPADRLKAIRDRYRHVLDWTWAQEESQNMGAWSFVQHRLRDLLGHDVHYVGRDASASTATGSLKVHEKEQAELVEAAILGSGGHVVSAASPGPVVPVETPSSAAIPTGLALAAAEPLPSASAAPVVPPDIPIADQRPGSGSASAPANPGPSPGHTAPAAPRMIATGAGPGSATRVPAGAGAGIGKNGSNPDGKE